MFTKRIHCYLPIYCHWYDVSFLVIQIEYKSRELLSVREDLHSTWQQQNDHLSALYEQQLFYREAQHLQDISASQEAYLNAAITADSVEQVETLVKKHENFEKLLATQENKVHLGESGEGRENEV